MISLGCVRNGVEKIVVGARVFENELSASQVLQAAIKKCLNGL